MKRWYKRRLDYLTALLLPFSTLYFLGFWIKRFCYRIGWFKTYHSPIPLVVIGNLTVGGVGKTPLVVSLCERLQAHGYKVGIISRGYKGRSTHWPRLVDKDTSVDEVGDEALMMALKCGCPVVVGPRRRESIQYLHDHTDVNVILSDDGLQHFAVKADIEIVVVDSLRLFGNKKLLPAGPLRESWMRLKTVDAVVMNGPSLNSDALSCYVQSCPVYHMMTEVSGIYSCVDSSLKQDWSFFSGKSVLAMAGIGHPQRFFNSLSECGVCFDERTFPDHHQYQIADLQSSAHDALIMTEKDWVKCRDFSLNHAYFIKIQAKIVEDDFYHSLIQKLESIACA